MSSAAFAERRLSLKMSFDFSFIVPLKYVLFTLFEVSGGAGRRGKFRCNSCTKDSGNGMALTSLITCTSRG